MDGSSGQQNALTNGSNTSETEAVGMNHAPVGPRQAQLLTRSNKCEKWSYELGGWHYGW